MQTTPQQLPPLAEYIGPRELLPDVKNHFPTLYSLAWFTRKHRDALAACGAVIKPSGRMLYHSRLFQQAVTQIGQQGAFQTGGEGHVATA